MLPYKEVLGIDGGWSTNGFPFGSATRLVSGRSVTHFGENLEGIYGWAHRRFVDSANYLQPEIARCRLTLRNPS